jgi:hypothetical protein
VGCKIYVISAWGVQLEEANQTNLVITPSDESELSVDYLGVAQFIYLLLHNEKIREVIDTITSMAVLILGRFTPERKAILDAIREEMVYPRIVSTDLDDLTCKIWVPSLAHRA